MRSRRLGKVKQYGCARAATRVYGVATSVRGWRHAVVAIVVLIVSVAPANAVAARAAGVPAPGFAATDFATGFASICCFVGPVGLAFDTAGRLLVADYPQGSIYKFGTSGGSADTTTLVGSVPGGRATGLAFTKDGHLYMARQSLGDVLQIDPYTATVLGTAASGISNPTGLAVDPISGDLFVSQAGGGPAVWRIKDPQNNPGVRTLYANVDVDGMTFGPDGTLYGALGSNIYRIAGTNSSSPGAVTPIATLAGSDGIALLAPPPGSTVVTSLAVNRWNGSVTVVDFSQTPATFTDIVTGGGRGDFVAVGPDKCLYATQPDSIEKITAADGSCPFLPTGVVNIPPSVMVATGLQVDGFAGFPLAAPIATLSDTDLSAVPSEFTATVLWGDGQEVLASVLPTSSASPVTCPATSPPSRCLIVYGQHTYPDNGTFNVVVHVTKVNNQVATAIAVARITRSARAPVNVSMFGWDISGAVSADRGLIISDAVLNEFKLGRRPMAEDMSIPYLTVLTSSSPEPRRITLSPAAIELGPDGSFIASSRLVQGPVVDSTSGDQKHGIPGILLILAKYRVDLSPNPSGQTSWLEISQRYEFHQEMSPTNPAFPACEPSQEGNLHGPPLNCARWKPIVDFKFHGGSGDQLLSINVVERLHFLPDSKPVKATTLTFDCDGTNASPAGDVCQPFYLKVIALYRGEDPILNEAVVRAITNNQTSGYDNLHLTWNDAVGLPGLPLPPPGCAECVHMHWRWGQFASGGNPLFGLGQPLLAAGSIPPSPNPNTDQSLDVALVTNHPGQESPQNFRDLVQGLDSSGYGGGTEALIDPVVFLSAMATNETSDAFFAFGGFFGSQT